MDYIELTCKIVPYKPESAEIMTALLADYGFESFADTENGFKAYIPEKHFRESDLDDLLSQYKDETAISFGYEIIKERNWNAEWESGYQAVIISGRCMIRAPFHDKDPSMDYDVVIEPKMSFGTAHHETTHMMIEMVLNENLEDKSVLDMGCGTGVLAILSEKRGAKSVIAIDNDRWAYENATGNLRKNNSSRIVVKYGDAELLKNESFDIILANINRNILLNDMKEYVKVLNYKGRIIMSGFYISDLMAIKNEAGKYNLQLDSYIKRNDWTAAKFV